MGVIYQDHSQCTKIVFLGVLPEVLYHFCGSTPAKVVQHFVFLVQEYSQKHYSTFVGVLPQKWYSTYGSTSRRPKISNTGSTPRHALRVVEITSQNCRCSKENWHGLGTKQVSKWSDIAMLILNHLSTIKEFR